MFSRLTDSSFPLIIALNDVCIAPFPCRSKFPPDAMLTRSFVQQSLVCPLMLSLLPLGSTLPRLRRFPVWLVPLCLIPDHRLIPSFYRSLITSPTLSKNVPRVVVSTGNNNLPSNTRTTSHPQIHPHQIIRLPTPTHPHQTIPPTYPHRTIPLPATTKMAM